ncbi:MAG TPA: PPOX class F420-dependent oxidoreductase [Gaiellaceae bacterium]|nr:PPOX class F420-dependent oxidoreductase [Gaiellaceae bacterium]
MSRFDEAELEYLEGARRLGRIATVGRDGTPHVVPIGMWRYNAAHDTIDVGGRDPARTKWFRDVVRSGRAAFLVDDLASTDPFRPRAVEIRGRAEALDDSPAVVRIHPDRVVSWGLGGGSPGSARRARVRAPGRS